MLRASDVISRERAQASSSADVLPSAGSIFEGVTRRLARLPYTLHAPASRLEPSSLTACLWLSMCVIRSSLENTDDRIWEAEIWYEGVHYTLGAFESEETAGRAYACAAFSLYDSAAIEVGIQQAKPSLFQNHSHAEREKIAVIGTIDREHISQLMDRLNVSVVRASLLRIGHLPSRKMLMGNPAWM